MIVLVVAAFFYLGAQLAARIQGPETTSPLERASAAALLGASIWIAVNWILSAPHWLNGPALLVSAGIAAVTAFLLRRPRVERVAISRAWLILVPMAIWIAFALWRAYVLPVVGDDAFIYHMPRAVLLWRAGGYTWVPNAPDIRINAFAANYELLVADVLAVQHADTIAEWTSVLFFVLLLLVSAAVACRWWGEGKHLFAVPYLVATIPIVILHTGAIKNDVMSHFFALSALLWGGRWFSTRRFSDAALCIVALFAGLGTKNHLLLLVGIFGVIFFFRSLPINRSSLTFFIRLTAVAVIAFLLLGGVH
ncbi:MAG TPA: hypothetical protein VHY33_14955, partial [Thermoanaerobaculia bacterium]|nr:hypothetical protein [Thermoanaerobaculia bacterium]